MVALWSNPWKLRIFENFLGLKKMCLDRFLKFFIPMHQVHSIKLSKKAQLNLCYIS